MHNIKVNKIISIILINKIFNIFKIFKKVKKMSINNFKYLRVKINSNLSDITNIIIISMKNPNQIKK